MPAELAYGALVAALGEEARAVAKDLELYAGDDPPAGYGLATECAGIARVAGELGAERFHLVGYSAGGAASLAYVASDPERVLSLALLEPAWAGNDGVGPAEAAAHDEFRRIMDLPPEARMPEFIRYQLAPGVAPPPPPPGAPPPWMAKRPPGLVAIQHAFESYELDLDVLRAFSRPVLYVLGGLSNPDVYARRADRLAAIFPDFTVETYPDRHHFDPPHRIEPDALAATLRRLWSRAEAGAGRPAGV